jgi:beta-glucuronidase
LHAVNLYASNTRRRLDLAGLWQFSPAPAELPPDDWRDDLTMLLPGCWNTQNPEYYYQSIAWVRKEVFVPADWPVACRLFCGIHAWELAVWVNGTRVGTHTGYLSTWLDVEVHPGKPNTFLLRMDASETDDRIGTRFDVNNPGGVFGALVLEAREAVSINNLGVRTELAGEGALVRVSAGIAGQADALRLRILDCGHEVAAHVTATVRDTVEAAITLPEARSWSPDDPHLYTLEAEVEAAGAVDQVSLRFGIRTIEVRERGIYLNGALQSIRGMLTFNDHPDTSRYLPTHIILKDFWIAKHANVNAWRHHYPASQEFLELADRYGFLVIESVPLVWNDDLRKPEIVRQAKQQLREMIERGRNHPCIIGWGVWNELGVFHDWYSDEEYKQIVKDVTRELLREAERLDPTRFALFATGLILDEPCLELEEAKVLGINLYPRVYDPHIWKTSDPLEAELKKGIEVLSLVRSKFPDKAILMTEFGWQTIPGLRDFRNCNWSEDYQAKFIGKLVPEMTRIGVCGFMFSCYADWMTRPVMKAPIEAERPGELGYWGMLDQYRRPKLVYNTIRDLYGEMKSQ